LGASVPLTPRSNRGRVSAPQFAAHRNSANLLRSLRPRRPTSLRHRLLSDHYDRYSEHNESRIAENSCLVMLSHDATVSTPTRKSSNGVQSPRRSNTRRAAGQSPTIGHTRSASASTAIAKRRPHERSPDAAGRAGGRHRESLSHVLDRLSIIQPPTRLGFPARTSAIVSASCRSTCHRRRGN
jgi:hypothetical protein